MTMEEKFQNREELLAAADVYTQQLQDLEAHLLSKPSDAEALEMRNALQEVLQLTRDLLDSDTPLSVLTVVEQTQHDPLASSFSLAAATSEPCYSLEDGTPTLGLWQEQRGEKGVPREQSKEEEGVVLRAGFRQPGNDIRPHKRTSRDSGNGLEDFEAKHGKVAGAKSQEMFTRQRVNLDGENIAVGGGKRKIKTEMVGQAPPEKKNKEEWDDAQMQEMVPLRGKAPRGMHPRNKYADQEPDFEQLARAYPSLRPYVMPPRKGKGKSQIDWTDFNATRELTRALLHHDFQINWWIGDGQLCPPVPNRANYLHWLQDLLALSPAPWAGSAQGEGAGGEVRGVDIGTGASCIYALLGAAICGWRFVATDITEAAIRGATRNIRSNPHLAHLIELRRAVAKTSTEPPEAHFASTSKSQSGHRRQGECQVAVRPAANSVTELGHDPEGTVEKGGCDDKESFEARVEPRDQEANVEGAREFGQPGRPTDEGLVAAGRQGSVEEELPWLQEGAQEGPKPEAPVLVGVVEEGERFHMCMCNPPFFESIEEAGANPHTACGGTAAEMVYPGGEEAFIGRIIADSLVLRKQIHWYTTLVGKKQHLKPLKACLHQSQVAVVRTTEFVQGRTSRWGLAWSFSPLPPAKLPASMARSKLSFSLQGLRRQTSAWEVLQALAAELCLLGAPSTVDPASFSLQGGCSATSAHPGGSHGHEQVPHLQVGRAEPAAQGDKKRKAPTGSADDVAFKAEVFQHAPGAVTIAASLVPGGSTSTAQAMQRFAAIFHSAEEVLRRQFEGSKAH